MKGINIFLADGFEDSEALATNDVLRRGGLDVNLVSVTDEPFAMSSHRVTVGTDACLGDLDTSAEGTGPEDMMIFPGGMPGTKNLALCAPLMEAMKAHYDAGGCLAAICAAPGLVLGQLEERLDGVEFTCFDGFEEIPVSFGGVFTPRPAVTCGRIITGRSAGHAVSFGLAILEKLKGSGCMEKVRHAMYLETL